MTDYSIKVSILQFIVVTTYSKFMHFFQPYYEGIPVVC